MIHPEAEAAVKYEYHIEPVELPMAEEELIPRMNALGAEGWQLVTMTITNEARLWFMRPLLPAQTVGQDVVIVGKMFSGAVNG